MKKFEPEEIKFVKEGTGYTLYVDDVHCGWGDLIDVMDDLNDAVQDDRFKEFVEDCKTWN